MTTADQETGYVGHSTDPYSAIGDYALIGDGHTAALVSREGSIDWACFPRFDSPSVFGRILDYEGGGYWSIAPTASFKVEREYVDETNILRTIFTTESGRAEVVDFMPVGTATQQRLETNYVVRSVRGLSGEVALESVCAPRFDYGRGEPEWHSRGENTAETRYGDATLILVASASITADDGEARSRIHVRAGEEMYFVAVFGEPALRSWRQDMADEAPRWREETENWWCNWIGRCTYEGPHAPLDE